MAAPSAPWRTKVEPLLTSLQDADAYQFWNASCKMATLGLTDEESEEYDSSCSGSTPEWLYEIHQNFLEGKILPYQYEPLRSDYKPSQSDAEDEDDSPESEMETEPENRMEDLASW